MPDIVEIKNKSEIPMGLLLEGDENEEFVNSYLAHSLVYGIVDKGTIVAICLIVDLPNQQREIVNLAVDVGYRRRGYAGLLIRHACEHASREGINGMVVQTCMESPSSMPLYLQSGFVLESVDPDYFVRNYPHPIIEEGVICRDRARLVKKLR